MLPVTSRRALHFVPLPCDRYTSYSNSSTGAVSGSYVFHPVGPATALDSSAATTPQATLTVVRGTHLTEVWQRWSPTVQTVTRVYKTGEPIATAFVEVDHGVGPLPGNREVITRYHTNLCTVSPASACATGKGGVPSWFSDNNGQQYQQRTSNAAGFAGFPDASYNISANYAPVVRSAFLRDTAGNRQFAVLTSRTHGAASLVSAAACVIPYSDPWRLNVTRVLWYDPCFHSRTASLR